MTPDEILETELDRLDEKVQSGTGAFWKKLRESRLPIGILALSTAVVQLHNLPEEFSSTTLDAAAIMQWHVEAKQVRLVDIDDDEYAHQYGGKSPLGPAPLSELLAEIASGSPALMVVDDITSHQMFKGMAVPRNVPIIWAVENHKGATPPFEPDGALGGTAPLKPNAALDLLPLDKQGLVRSYALEFPLKAGGYIPSLETAAAETYRRIKGLPELSGSGEGERLLDFRYRFFPMSAKDVHTKSRQKGWHIGELADKIVVVGGTFAAARDDHATPVGLRSGLEIAGQGIEAEIENTSVSPANPWFAGLLELAAGFGLVMLYKSVGLRIAILSSIILIPALSMAASVILFHRFALWGALLPVLISILIAELYTQASTYLTICKRIKEARQGAVPSDPETQDSSKAAGKS